MYFPTLALSKSGSRSRLKSLLSAHLFELPIFEHYTRLTLNLQASKSSKYIIPSSENPLVSARSGIAKMCMRDRHLTEFLLSHIPRIDLIIIYNRTEARTTQRKFSMWIFPVDIVDVYKRQPMPSAISFSLPGRFGILTR